MNKTWEDFDNIWAIDYEFRSQGNPNQPLCYAGKNLLTGETVSRWIDGTEKKPEYSTDDKTLIIAFVASAEIGCHLSLGFDIPLYILDLYNEFRNLTNGLKLGVNNSLIGASLCYGLSSSNSTHKEHMRNRILQGPPYSPQEKKDILSYCMEDVEMTASLYYPIKKSMEEEGIALQYALLRGRYSSAAAQMEYLGVPVDVPKLEELKDCWDMIKEDLIYRVNEKYHVYDKTVFKRDKFNKYLENNNIPWSYTPSGLPKTDQAYMKEKAKAFPQLKSLQELKHSTGQLRKTRFLIGEDGRNRTPLFPFSAVTSRSYPKSSEFIFANAVWSRSLIKPQKGMAISYIDFEQQELGVAASLSKDENLLKAYLSGDPYIEFAKNVGATPKNATKKTHPEIREKYKTAMLATNYGQGYRSFAQNIGVIPSEGKFILDAHKANFSTYWKWITNFIDVGKLTGEVRTQGNWLMKTKDVGYRTLLNWPMQAEGSEILRLAICLCFENNIKVIAPVHDAILIEDTIENIDSSVKKAQQYMEEASDFIIGLKLRTEVKTFKYPERYKDPRGKFMWDTVQDIISHLNPAERKARMEEKIMEKMPLDNWVEKSTLKPKPYLSKRMQQQRMMRPQSISEREMVDRIKKMSNWPHMEIMHLVNLARNTDFDLEHEIDWKHEDYDMAKEKVQQKQTMRDILVME